MGTVKDNSINYCLGIIGALLGFLAVAVLWFLLVTITDRIFFYVAVLIGIVPMILFAKFGKGTNLIINIVIFIMAVIVLYGSFRVSYTKVVQDEMEDQLPQGTEVTYSDAALMLDYAIDKDDSFSLDYHKNLVLSYVALVAGSVVFVFSKKEKKKV